MISSIAFTSRALDVTRLGGLHRGVDETLAASHGVEEELLRGQPAQVRVLDEAPRLGAEVVLGKVRQRPVGEAKREFASLRRSAGRRTRIICEMLRNEPLEPAVTVIFTLLVSSNESLRRVTGVVTRLVRESGSPSAQTTAAAVMPGCDLELALLARCPSTSFTSDLRLGDGVVDVPHGPVVGDRVGDADGEAVVEQPVVESHCTCDTKSRAAVGPHSSQMVWIKPPPPLPIDFLHMMPVISSPRSTRTPMSSTEKSWSSASRAHADVLMTLTSG